MDDLASGAEQTQLHMHASTLLFSRRDDRTRSLTDKRIHKTRTDLQNSAMDGSGGGGLSEDTSSMYEEVEEDDGDVQDDNADEIVDRISIESTG